MTASPITHRLCSISRRHTARFHRPASGAVPAARRRGDPRQPGRRRDRDRRHHVRRAAPARRYRALRHHLRAGRVRRHRQCHRRRGVPARAAPAGGRRALCHLGVHRLAGAGRGRAAARQARRLSLGLARAAHRVRRDPRCRPRRARRQYRDRRRRHRRHRFRVDPGSRDRRAGDRASDPAWHRICAGAPVRCRLSGNRRPPRCWPGPPRATAPVRRSAVRRSRKRRRGCTPPGSDQTTPSVRKPAIAASL